MARIINFILNLKTKKKKRMKLILPIGFDGDGCKGERVRQSQGEAGEGALAVRRPRGDDKGHGEREQRCQQQNGRQFASRGFDHRRVPVPPKHQRHRQRQ